MTWSVSLHWPAIPGSCALLCYLEEERPAPQGAFAILAICGPRHHAAVQAVLLAAQVVSPERCRLADGCRRRGRTRLVDGVDGTFSVLSGVNSTDVPQEIPLGP